MFKRSFTRYLLLVLFCNGTDPRKRLKRNKCFILSFVRFYFQNFKENFFRNYVTVKRKSNWNVFNIVCLCWYHHMIRINTAKNLADTIFSVTLSIFIQVRSLNRFFFLLRFFLLYCCASMHYDKDMSKK